MSSLHDKKADIPIEYVSEDRRVGAYADVTRISVSPYTISLEFAQVIPPHGSLHQSARVIDRIVMSPGHARAFYDLLGENLKLYEEKFGEAKSFEPTAKKTE